MPHTYACDLRWADLDLLGHVNNVRYLDYAAEARAALFEGLPAGRADVASHQVEFVAPLQFSRRPVCVDSWVTAVGEDRVRLAQEVYDLSDGARTVNLRVTTELAHRLDAREREVAERHPGPEHTWRELTHERRPPRSTFDLHLRRADLDEQGRIGDAIVFEHLQESRIRYVMGLHTRGRPWTHHVIARTDVRYLAPIAFRSASYAVDSWIGHVGTKSFSICAEIRDAGTTLVEATVVMVAFDPETQRPAAMATDQRERLLGELRTG